MTREKKLMQALREKSEYIHEHDIREPSHDPHTFRFDTCNSLLCVRDRDLYTEPAAPAGEPWKCGAQPTADPPSDCDWPVCGCDPYASKVIDALEEAGMLRQSRIIERQPPEDSRRCIQCGSDADAHHEPVLARERADQSLTLDAPGGLDTPEADALRARGYRRINRHSEPAPPAPQDPFGRCVLLEHGMPHTQRVDCLGWRAQEPCRGCDSPDVDCQHPKEPETPRIADHEFWKPRVRLDDRCAELVGDRDAYTECGHPASSHVQPTDSKSEPR